MCKNIKIKWHTIDAKTKRRQRRTRTHIMKTFNYPFAAFLKILNNYSEKLNCLTIIIILYFMAFLLI